MKHGAIAVVVASALLLLCAVPGAIDLVDASRMERPGGRRPARVENCPARCLGRRAGGPALPGRPPWVPDGVDDARGPQGGRGMGSRTSRSTDRSISWNIIAGREHDISPIWGVAIATLGERACTSPSGDDTRSLWIVPRSSSPIWSTPRCTGMPTEVRPVTVPEFTAWKSQRRRISVLTAYDFPTARLLDAAGVDCLLVGDSMGTTIQGWETTLRVTLDQMIYHTEMVARAARRALVVADLPFLSYQVSAQDAIRSAGRILKETNCQAVKLEGGRKIAATIKAMVEAEIPVMGHVGLTPQSIRRLGSYKVQRSADEILADAQAVADAGAFAVVLECIPRELAAKITAQVPIPTIGIGAGPNCDGQVLVIHDMLGLIEGFKPKFARRYAELGEQIRAAVASYVADVAEGRFPSDAESFR